MYVHFMGLINGIGKFNTDTDNMKISRVYHIWGLGNSPVKLDSSPSDYLFLAAFLSLT